MAEVKWIKIVTGIFDDEKILLIESLPSSDSIIVIWFKLLTLAGKQNNDGVFLMGNRIPYTEEMLATIFRRDIGIVRLAIKTFEKFGMIEVVENVITIPNWNKHQTLDAYEKKKERDRIYQHERREKQKKLAIESSDSQTTPSSYVAVSEGEEEREEEGDKKEKKHIANAKRSAYYPNDENLDKSFKDFLEMRKKIKKPMTDRAVELAMAKLNNLSNGDNDKAIAIIEQSVLNGWQTFYPLKDEQRKSAGKQSNGIDWDNI